MNLTDLRTKIDAIDDKLLELFKQRMAVVSDIAAHKKDAKLPVLDRSREEEKLNELAQKADAPLKKHTRMLFGTLFGLSRKYQHENAPAVAATEQKFANALCEEIQSGKTTHAGREFPETAMVACQGVEGSFAELASERLFRKPPVIQYMKTYDSVFTAIENGFCDYGVLPLENSTAGSVNKVYRAMRNHNFRITRSIRLKVDHHLVAPAGVKLADIREVVSHEQALAQCDGYLTELGKRQEIMQTQYNNTAAAAEMVANSPRRDIAAICSQRCVEQYNLSYLEENIQDNPNNFTRFICISKNLEVYEGATHTDMILTLKNYQGVLFDVVSIVNKIGIDMSKLESRPTDSDEEFMFYVTFKTAVNDDLFRLVTDLVPLCKRLEYLGSYTEVV